MQESKLTIRGELSLLLVIIINSLGVVLMLHSGSGISAISSVPYAFADVLPVITLGAWTEVFQVSLVLSLMLLSKRFVPVYLFSFVVGSAFSAMIDVHEMWIKQLPQSLTLDIIYFIISYIVICFGVALANRYALNEVAILKNASASMLAMDTSVDTTMLNTYLGDGLIIATPTI